MIPRSRPTRSRSPDVHPGGPAGRVESCRDEPEIRPLYVVREKAQVAHRVIGHALAEPVHLDDALLPGEIQGRRPDTIEQGGEATRFPTATGGRHAVAPAAGDGGERGAVARSPHRARQRLLADAAEQALVFRREVFEEDPRGGRASGVRGESSIQGRHRDVNPHELRQRVRHSSASSRHSSRKAATRGQTYPLWGDSLARTAERVARVKEGGIGGETPRPRARNEGGPGARSPPRLAAAARKTERLRGRRRARSVGFHPRSSPARFVRHGSRRSSYSCVDRRPCSPGRRSWSPRPWSPRFPWRVRIRTTTRAASDSVFFRGQERESESSALRYSPLSTASCGAARRRARLRLLEDARARPARPGAAPRARGVRSYGVAGSSGCSPATIAGGRVRTTLHALPGTTHRLRDGPARRVLRGLRAGDHRRRAGLADERLRAATLALGSGLTWTCPDATTTGARSASASRSRSADRSNARSRSVRPFGLRSGKREGRADVRLGSAGKRQCDAERLSRAWLSFAPR